MGQGSSLNKNLLVSSVIALWLEGNPLFNVELLDMVILRGKESPTPVYEINQAC
jgi:hypothetical protein